ncbi:hypothetical protein TREAZ_3036 [Leadbettera azotonutricia ZAS-9]|uniref:Uncharacterized protein n=1 Tax=Leadbettera azotonutricia (strain ATCC BAA-888 / DSM 13862 / ZAS-9) TaxID=545695 RepID=F5YB33_LEAAZ|nr:hypothetical protein TREAZ_3036 [Leadbettera azotonutricia ZAS-9]
MVHHGFSVIFGQTNPFSGKPGNWGLNPFKEIKEPAAAETGWQNLP